MGVVVAMLVAMVLLGGIKRIGSVTEKLVPFMALFYVVLAVGVVVLNVQRLPYVLESIIAGAFNPRAFTGGAIGSCVPQRAERRLPRYLLQRGRPRYGLHRPCLRRYPEARQAGNVRHL